MIEDISDVLYKQFSGEMREKILHAFGGFCSGHLTAMEVSVQHRYIGFNCPGTSRTVPDF